LIDFVVVLQPNWSEKPTDFEARETRKSRPSSLSKPVTFASSSLELTSVNNLHKHEIQSIEVAYNDDGSYRLGCVDSAGHSSFSRLSSSSHNDEGPSLKKRKIEQSDSKSSVTSSFQISASRFERAVPSESGFSGLALHPRNQSSFLTASFFSRSLTIYDASSSSSSVSSSASSTSASSSSSDSRKRKTPSSSSTSSTSSDSTPLRTFYLQQCPTSVKYMNVEGSNEPLVLLNENNVVSVWDVRDKRGCIQRLQVRVYGSEFLVSSREHSSCFRSFSLHFLVLLFMH
jgi:hypothetical protein